MASAFRRVWARLVSVGVRPQTPPRDAGFIRASNSTAYVVSLWLLVIVGATFTYFFPIAPELVWANLAAVALVASSPVWKRFGWYRASDAVLLLTCLAVVTFNALHFGRESWNHLFLLAAVLIGFNYIQSRGLVTFNTAAGIALFALVEVRAALGLPGLIEAAVPAEILELFRVASIYNLVFLMIGLAAAGRGIVRRTQDLLEQERRRSEELLLNILPESIAARLRSGSGSIADGVDEASILFADLVGFTQVSRSMPASELVTMLNEIFTGFDRDAVELGLEKIKTIGDSYMVAAGVPDPRADHAVACLAMARAMLAHTQRVCQRWPGLRLRIGIHSGPVVAGVIGESKFAYDLWGDTVNLASRMETHGLPGRIHLSQATRELLDGQADFEARGLTELKGHAAMQTYLVKE